ncbi:hypothetical protein [Flavobacterium saccharophilum]|uniref:Lipoprotein n=1 Tax=Flavobacterium saccharophilum TaxID=29534 RepID=A0A1M7MCV4_9FLAO|nr:hypothetical protein [Flavobacterium saccharophilum]SHM88652.1 hypothetical protein SAMN05444366_4485 [Flavobacterium saccharophilum]
MKQILIAIFSLATLTSCKTGQDTSTPPKPTAAQNRQMKSFALDSVVQTIQTQYIIALADLKAKGLVDKVEITNAELSLTVTRELSGSADLSVLIFGASGSITRSNATGLTFVLSKKEDPRGGSTNALADNKNTLADLIVLGAEKFIKLKSLLGNLEKDSFELHIVFSIEKKGGPKIALKFWGIDSEIGVEKSGAVEHEMVLTFKEIAPVVPAKG